MKNKMMMLAAVLAIGGSTLAFGQDRDDRGRDRDDHDRQVVNNGWNGRRDNDARWRDNDDRRDRDDRRDNDNRWARTDRDGDHDGDRRQAYTYSYPVYNGGYYGNGYGYQMSSYGWNTAQQVGYQDGLNAGRSDRMTGHSFRFQQWGAFQSATHGYSYGFGNVGQYRAAYRQAFQSGYQQGYEGGY